jgi:hypothetical protein
VENVSEFGELDALSQHVARRSVFSLDNFKAMMQESSRPIKVIDFLLVGHSDPPVSLEQLIRSGIFHSRTPQSISMISDEAYKRLKQQLSFGYKI